MKIGKYMDVFNSNGHYVTKVHPATTSIGVELKTGFPVIKKIVSGRLVWFQNGKAYPAEKRNHNFGQPGYTA